MTEIAEAMIEAFRNYMRDRNSTYQNIRDALAVALAVPPASQGVATSEALASTDAATQIHQWRWKRQPAPQMWRDGTPPTDREHECDTRVLYSDAAAQERISNLEFRNSELRLVNAAQEREIERLTKERDDAREYGKQARLRENAAEDKRTNEQH